MTPRDTGIWIQGAGELASGLALRLFRCGYRIVMAEIPRPMAVRRRVCFSEAVYNGSADVEGVPGRLVDLDEVSWQYDHIPVFVDPVGAALDNLNPAAVVDARLTKKAPVPLPGSHAPVIGLGPGFVCGRDARYVIETHREARLGEVICEGGAVPNTGIPGPVGGQSASRVVRAPRAGRLAGDVAIGDLVRSGQILGHIDGQPVLSNLAGMVRGLVHPAAELSAGEKVGDIDPRGNAVDPAKVTDKALAVGGGVLEALLRLSILPEGQARP